MFKAFRPPLTANSESNKVREGLPGPIKDSPAAMRIRVSDPALINDLVEYLLRKDCDVIKTSRNVVAVSLSHALPYDAARFELDFHLADWRLGQPGTTAIVID
jgi:hypothetical protein